MTTGIIEFDGHTTRIDIDPANPPRVIFRLGEKAEYQIFLTDRGVVVQPFGHALRLDRISYNDLDAVQIS